MYAGLKASFHHHALFQRTCFGRNVMDVAKPGIKTEVIPYIFYRDVPGALDWLARAFGFTEVLRHPTAHGMYAEMMLDGQLIMMGQGSTDWRMQSPSETKIATMGIFIYLAAAPPG
jgi:hypothetical protein